MTQTVKELAEAAFEADERVRALSAMNEPTDYEERKKAFVELAIAKAEAVKAKTVLANATYSYNPQKTES